MKDEYAYHVPFDAPLNKEDTKEHTKGCRQNDPSICKYNGIANICAFERSDHICMHPSRAWSKQFSRLRKTNKK